MGWDRHKLLCDGNGTDKYVPWTTLSIPTIVIIRDVVLTKKVWERIKKITILK